MEYNVVIIVSIFFATLIGFGCGGYGVYFHYQKAKTRAEKRLILALGGAIALHITLTFSMSFFVSAFAGIIVCSFTPALTLIFHKKYQKVCEGVV